MIIKYESVTILVTQLEYNILKDMKKKKYNEIKVLSNLKTK